jgi:bifunctional UDP-N-acetylglucosamine pyrophosphorylase/glucosamine-1-phosphate N-acetyltransferase
MLNGVYMQNSKSIYIDSDVVFKGECFLYANTHLIGKSIINNSTIKPNSIIESSNIDNSTIGPYGRVRPNCNIKDSFVGNFVEVKNSKLTNVKAGHLSYLGDSDINSGTNIGAGCITCNYDGKTKHKTTIGRNVFVGSNSALVAPIIIEDDVLIGASSVVTKNVPKGSLVTTRVSKPKVIANYFYKFFSKKK